MQGGMKGSTKPGQNFDRFLQLCKRENPGTFLDLIDTQEEVSMWVSQGHLRSVCFQVQGSGAMTLQSKTKSLAPYQTHYVLTMPQMAEMGRKIPPSLY